MRLAGAEHAAQGGPSIRNGGQACRYSPRRRRGWCLVALTDVGAGQVILDRDPGEHDVGPPVCADKGTLWRAARGAADRGNRKVRDVLGVGRPGGRHVEADVPDVKVLEAWRRRRVKVGLLSQVVQSVERRQRHMPGPGEATLDDRLAGVGDGKPRLAVTLALRAAPGELVAEGGGQHGGGHAVCACAGVGKGASVLARCTCDSSS
eukprot:350728-Chlamydomonas_euryale.AAC.2